MSSMLLGHLYSCLLFAVRHHILPKLRPGEFAPFDFGLAWRTGSNETLISQFDQRLLLLQEDGTVSQARACRHVDASILCICCCCCC